MKRSERIGMLLLCCARPQARSVARIASRKLEGSSWSLSLTGGKNVLNYTHNSGNNRCVGFPFKWYMNYYIYRLQERYKFADPHTACTRKKET